MYYDQNQYLMHYGIRGQKWGIRRFQNEDHSLTAEGKERYGRASKNRKREKPESSTWRSRDAKKLSDEELNRRNNRLQRERQYRELTATRGQKFMKSLGKSMSKIFVLSLVGAATGIMATHYKDLLKIGEDFITEAASMPIDLTNLR